MECEEDVVAPFHSDHVRCLLADHDGGGVGVPRGDRRHDGSVHHPEPRHAVHPAEEEGGVRNEGEIMDGMVVGNWTCISEKRMGNV